MQDCEEQEEQEKWEQEIQIWSTCAQATQTCRAMAINLFLVASEPNLVWEQSWAYNGGLQERRPGGQSESLQKTGRLACICRG